MTAGDRLVSLAKSSGTAAALLLLIGSGDTAGEALTNYSKLPTGTAAEHLLVDHAIQQAGAAGGSKAKAKRILVEVDGKNVFVRSIDEFYALLDAIRDKAPEEAKKKAIEAIKTDQDIKPPEVIIKKIEAPKGDLSVAQYLDDVKRHVARINEQIQEIYREALIREAMRVDEEEAILAILMD